jgi:hypothetical protein
MSGNMDPLTEAQKELNEAQKAVDDAEAELKTAKSGDDAVVTIATEQKLLEAKVRLDAAQKAYDALPAQSRGGGSAPTTQLPPSRVVVSSQTIPPPVGTSIGRDDFGNGLWGVIVVYLDANDPDRPIELDQYLLEDIEAYLGTHQPDTPDFRKGLQNVLARSLTKLKCSLPRDSRNKLWAECETYLGAQGY